MYQRFLTDNDYLAIITQDSLNQLIREVHDRIPQAEQSAEMDMREYLDQYYEIENELAKGKAIKEYSELINYPSGVYFKRDEVIYKTLTSINGIKKPTNIQYWGRVVDTIGIKDIDKVQRYFQTRTYQPGDVVTYGTEYWKCIVGNGIDYNNIQIPGVHAWVIVPYSEWQPNVDYPTHSVVVHKDVFYTLIDKVEDMDLTLTPVESTCWGQIGEYTTDYTYSCDSNSYDYVVSDGVVYKPIINPNADTLMENSNIVRDDPRNLNVIKHMTRIAIYYLHQTISPTNISETRRLMYEDSMNWLLMASKFKLNPQIKRKVDNNGTEKVDWALASYQKELNVDDNPWVI